MSSSEFVRVSSVEKDYGHKHLLQAQLELLDLAQRFQSFKKWRGEELVLKVTLKNKVERTLEMLKVFEKSLPVAHYKAPTPEARETEKKKHEQNLSLEEEIAAVRAKLTRIQQGY